MIGRVIAAAAFAAVAVYLIVRGVKSGKKPVLGTAIVEAASYFAAAGLFLVIPADYIMLPALLGVVLWAIPAMYGADNRQ